MQLSNFNKLVGLVTIAGASSTMTMTQAAATGSMTNSDGNMVSKLVYVGNDYNVELYLGHERTEANKGLFTIDSGSAQFIVNGDACTEELCTGPAGDPLKQFKTPPASDIVYPDLSILYGDGSGYHFNVYQAPVTIPSGQTIKKANIAYNFKAIPNTSSGTTDNFNDQGQGIIGLSVPCQASPSGAATITETIKEDGLGVNSFTACLKQ